MFGFRVFFLDFRNQNFQTHRGRDRKNLFLLPEHRQYFPRLPKKESYETLHFYQNETFIDKLKLIFPSNIDSIVFISGNGLG
ncbi:hypothetical protein DLM78_08605 [Leptospira stimsonii]|uniref:Uncharacterized protein n=1 Tax=Leptospira stimsonii TaxID=2202203 RepID=A0A8B3CPK4_9LEPT|nr:hypothetical protein DLM78_08605 [Leptospira stimsonii]